jgi:uncharacterized protein (DUF983 family)
MGTNLSIALIILTSLGVVGLFTVVGAYLGIEIAWNESTQHRARPWDLIRRALARKCPACGIGPIFQSHFKMNAECPKCRTIFWQSEGESLGPMVIDYTVAVTAALVAWAISILLNLSETIQICLVSAVGVASLIAVAPWSRSFWTAFLYVSGEMKPRDPQ